MDFYDIYFIFYIMVSGSTLVKSCFRYWDDYLYWQEVNVLNFKSIPFLSLATPCVYGI